MPSADQIAAQIGRTSHGQKVLTGARREITALQDILSENENIDDVITGTYSGGTGLLVATDRRLVFVDKGVLGGLKVEDFAYDRITSIQYGKGMMIFGSLTIFAAGNRAEISNVPKDRVQAFAEAVRARIASPPAPAPSAQAQAPASTDITGQLERLASLRDRGILTETEFKDQKRKLLDSP